ncbi:glucose/galactose MFS transporter, partial [Rufibacter sp. H-1]|nr:glucose/galactose MFS transporter [Rufibacter sediminis]
MSSSAASAPAATQTDAAPCKSYTGALMVVTMLFFMWGFITCMNDILIP